MNKNYKKLIDIISLVFSALFLFFSLKYSTLVIVEFYKNFDYGLIYLYSFLWFLPSALFFIMVIFVMGAKLK